MIVRSKVSNDDILKKIARNKFEKSPHSDFTVVLKETETSTIRRFHVHKFILTQQSTYFEDLFQNSPNISDALIFNKTFAEMEEVFTLIYTNQISLPNDRIDTLNQNLKCFGVNANVDQKIQTSNEQSENIEEKIKSMDKNTQTTKENTKTKEGEDSLDNFKQDCIKKVSPKSNFKQDCFEEVSPKTNRKRINPELNKSAIVKDRVKTVSNINVDSRHSFDNSEEMDMDCSYKMPVEHSNESFKSTELSNKYCKKEMSEDADSLLGSVFSMDSRNSNESFNPSNIYSKYCKQNNGHNKVLNDQITVNSCIKNSPGCSLDKSKEKDFECSRSDSSNSALKLPMKDCEDSDSSSGSVFSMDYRNSNESFNPSKIYSKHCKQKNVRDKVLNDQIQKIEEKYMEINNTLNDVECDFKDIKGTPNAKSQFGNVLKHLRTKCTTSYLTLTKLEKDLDNVSIKEEQKAIRSYRKKVIDNVSEASEKEESLRREIEKLL